MEDGLSVKTGSYGAYIVAVHGAFYFDDLRAEVGKDGRRAGAGEIAGKVEHFDAAEYCVHISSCQLP